MSNRRNPINEGVPFSHDYMAVTKQDGNVIKETFYKGGIFDQFGVYTGGIIVSEKQYSYDEDSDLAGGHNHKGGL